MFISCLLLAIALDLLLGDPPVYPHPVRIIGMLITAYENFYRRAFSSEKCAGFFTMVSVLISCFLFLACAFGALSFFGKSVFAPEIFATLLLYTCIAIKDLRKEAHGVYLAFDRGLDAARVQVARIVGRDTAALSEEGVIKAAVETVAENLSDGVIAPLFWACMGASLAKIFHLPYVDPIVYGASFAFIYKAINTMDSMIGYKNERYLHFGRYAAKLDDLANFIPARVTGLLIVVVALFTRNNPKRAFRILMRDRLAHASPNAGHPEAALAGMFGVQLCGPSSYFGKVVEKPAVGDRVVEIERFHILAANRVCLQVVALFVLFFTIIYTNL